jgi:hypothetical protein
VTEDLEGGCACAGVRYRLISQPMFVHCCHCRDCQRQTGSAFVLNALIETDRVSVLSGNPEPTAVPTDSGRPHHIYRCPFCKVAVLERLTAELINCSSSASARSTMQWR